MVDLPATVLRDYLSLHRSAGSDVLRRDDFPGLLASRASGLLTAGSGLLLTRIIAVLQLDEHLLVGTRIAQVEAASLGIGIRRELRGSRPLRDDGDDVVLIALLLIAHRPLTGLLSLILAGHGWLPLSEDCVIRIRSHARSHVHSTS